jgi:hypothetical protein
MDLKKITNLDTMYLTENSSELGKLNKYRSKEFVESYIGLGIHRSFFYGKKIGDKVIALDVNETDFNTSENIVLHIEGVVQLPRTPSNAGAGTISYEGYGIVEVNDSVVYNGNATATPPPAGSLTVVTNPASPYDTTDQEVVLVDATSGNKIVNLPPASTSDGYKVVVKKTDASAFTVTIEPDGAETIDGGSNAVITQENVSLTLICNGSAWFII